MKRLLASIAALGLIATPALAAPTPAKTTKTTTMTTQAKPATKSVAKAAKAEGESAKTEAKEHRAAARHHRAARCSCAKTKMAKSHKHMTAKARTTAKKGATPATPAKK